MAVDHVGKAARDDFLIPTIERLSHQLRKTIILDVSVWVDGEKSTFTCGSPSRDDFQTLLGEVRVRASAAAAMNRYKYKLQCIFEKEEGISGFSGIRLGGNVTVVDGVGINKYDCLMYTYNEWTWGAMFRL